MSAGQSSQNHTRSIIALNIVSTLSQIGQYGLGTALLPIGLEARHASPELIGFTSAAYWAGMLAGLLISRRLIDRLGYRMTVIIGLLISAISFIALPFIQWWAIAAVGIGLGTGFRWIGNETWLYQISPLSIRGQIVGIHETLIAIATFLGPLIIVEFGTIAPSAFWIAAGFCVVAIVPIFFAIQISIKNECALETAPNPAKALGFWHARFAVLMSIGLGAYIAGIGGWIDGSLVALLPTYVSSIGFSTTNAAWLITIMGIGALIFQFPIGWLSDSKGVLWTARQCTLITAIAVVLIVITPENFYILCIVAFILGGTLSGFLTLGIICATLQDVGRVITNSLRQISIVYTSFSAAGPLITGYLVSHTTIKSLFVQQLIATIVLLIILHKASNPAINKPSTKTS